MAGLGFDFTLLTSYLPYFMDASRRDESLGSEIKDFITHGTASCMVLACLLQLTWSPPSQHNSRMVPEIPSSLHIHIFS